MLRCSGRRCADPGSSECALSDYLVTRCHEQGKVSLSYNSPALRSLGVNR
ncbi:hypothetical protein HMPREF9005_2150 [Actinomyces sp. oral taxon 178 str. F0338]|nr:hypothetical protein HMPREF9005_2150 [Actinomyces sp. oral taxon 178 str. F0338]